MTELKTKPKANTSLAAQELDKAEAHFQAFDDNVKQLTLDRMNQAPRLDLEPQTKISQQDLAKTKDIYLKPHRTHGSKEKFNEKFRDDYNYAKEYVQFTAEHKELIGETIDMWTKPYPGMPAEEWLVPTNKPVWGPRYLKEQIQRCNYHVLSMSERTTGSNQYGADFGQLVADKIVNRIDAHEVSKNRTVFMGARSIEYSR